MSDCNEPIPMVTVTLSKSDWDFVVVALMYTSQIEVVQSFKVRMRALANVVREKVARS